MRDSLRNSLNNRVFLNIPYDRRFRKLYIAYLSGLIRLGLEPHATLEIPGGRNRLDKIIELIRDCRYSIHDLSRVSLDPTPPRTPRFNMPFELGLAVATAKFTGLDDCWFVFEEQHRRLSKSLSDLSGTDVNIHDGTVDGVMRELCNAFTRQSQQERATIDEMLDIYQAVQSRVRDIEIKTRAKSLFEPRVFALLSAAAKQAAISQKRD